MSKYCKIPLDNAIPIASINPYDFKVQNSKSNILDKTFTMIDNDTNLTAGELAPNGEVTGTLAYEEPINDPKLVLEYKPSFWSDSTIKVTLNH